MNKDKSMVEKATLKMRCFLGIPLTVWFLSLGMFFLNFSSVMIFTCMPLLPRYFAVKSHDVGSFEGIVEGFAMFMRAMSGFLSDFAKRRKRFLLIGYAICVLARWMMSIANGFEVICLARFVEKIGNGIQASPREALIGDVANAQNLGKSYGLNKALGMIGSTLGSAVLILFFSFYPEASIYSVFFGAGLLAFISFVILLVGVREPSSGLETQDKKKIPSVKVKRDLFEWMYDFIRKVVVFSGRMRDFSWEFWKSILLTFCYKMGYFSGAFMVSFIISQNFSSFLGIPSQDPAVLSAVVLSLQNSVCALFSFPLGWLSDRLNRRVAVGFGIVSLLASMLCFAFGDNQWIMAAGVIFYGVQFGTQGALMALLSSVMPSQLQGTGFGMFFVIGGLSIIISNTFFMRTIWAAYSPNFAFLVICVPVLISLIILPFIRVYHGKKDADQELV